MYACGRAAERHPQAAAAALPGAKWGANDHPSPPAALPAPAAAGPHWGRARAAPHHTPVPPRPPVGDATLPRQAAPGPSCASGGCVPFKGKGCGAPRRVRAGRAINCRLNELMADLMNELQTSVAEKTHTKLRRPWLRRLWLRKPTRN